ncbi:MAG: hypothetical protein ACKVQC_03865 [Elusimicrobiota bacterium]
MTKKISNFFLLGLFLVFWVLFALMYIRYSPDDARTYDFEGHVEYTNIIAYQDRLPSPDEAWQTYHPPLYYLINSFVIKKWGHHVENIRKLSVVYGLLCLIIIILFLRLIKIKVWIAMVVLLFISTAPAFLYMFTTYNNDSLFSLLSMLFFFLSYIYFSHSKKKVILVLLGLVTTAALYTKSNIVMCMMISSSIVLVSAVLKKIPWNTAFSYFFILGSATTLFLPWIIGHNYYYTGKLFPVNWDILGGELRLQESPFKVIFSIPGLIGGQFDNPYALNFVGYYSKCTNYFLYRFSSSLFGQHDYPFFLINTAWVVFVVRFLVCLMSVSKINLNKTTQLFGIVLVGVVPITYFYLARSPYSCSMDFRYLSWLWLGWALLYAQAIQSFFREKKNFLLISIILLMIVGSASQIKFMLDLIKA